MQILQWLASCWPSKTSSLQSQAHSVPLLGPAQFQKRGSLPLLVSGIEGSAPSIMISLASGPVLPLRSRSQSLPRSCAMCPLPVEGAVLYSCCCLCGSDLALSVKGHPLTPSNSHSTLKLSGFSGPFVGSGHVGELGLPHSMAASANSDCLQMQLKVSRASVPVSDAEAHDIFSNITFKDFFF